MIKVKNGQNSKERERAGKAMYTMARGEENLRKKKNHISLSSS